VHLDAVETAGATLGIVLAGVVDEDLTHDVGSEADEVGAAVPVDVFAGEAEVGFVDEGGGLESVVGALAAHVGLGEAVELGVDEREEALGGGGVAVVHSLEELSYFSGAGIGHGPILEQGLNGGGGACFIARASPIRLAGLRRLAQGRLPFLRRPHSTRSLPRTRSGQVVRFCFCTSETKFGELVRGFAAEVGRGETQVLRLRLFACANNLRSG
jgi:hypothetical protein